MSTVIEYNSSQEASEFPPLENGHDSQKKAKSLSPPMDHGNNDDYSPLLNGDSENSSQGSDLDPPVGDVYNFSNRIDKASATGVSPQYFNGGLLSHDDSESGSSSSLDSEPGLQTDYAPLEETDMIPSNQESSHESPTAKASESQSNTLVEDERSPDEASCLTSAFTTTETSPLQLDLRSPPVGSQDIRLGSQEPLHDVDQHAEVSCEGMMEPPIQPPSTASSLESTNSSCCDSQRLAENVASITETPSTTESLYSNAHNSEPPEELRKGEDGKPVAEETSGGSATATDPRPSETESIQPLSPQLNTSLSAELVLNKGVDNEPVAVETSGGSATATDSHPSETESIQPLSQQLNTSRLSAEPGDDMTHPSGEDPSSLQPDSPSPDRHAQSPEGEDHEENKAVVAVAATASVASIGVQSSLQEQPRGQGSDIADCKEELSENSNITVVQEGRNGSPEPSEQQEVQVTPPPSTRGDDQDGSVLRSSYQDMSATEESNLDSSNLDAGVRNARTNLPVLKPLSPTHELDQQYEYLRRTLSHSRRRYSTRRRQQHGRRGDDPSNCVSPERHERLRHTESSNAFLLRDHEGEPQQTRGQLRDILRTTQPVQRRESGRRRLFKWLMTVLFTNMNLS